MLKTIGSKASVWDYVIITASNEQQAISFREQIELRCSCGLLPASTVCGVVPDPPGERVGNGGALLGAMRFIYEHRGGDSSFSGIKALVILSSGDSRRVPQYSAMGKIFSPVPRVLPDGRPSTLFDEIILGFSSIPSRMSDGIVVLSGDVLLSFCVDSFVVSGGEDAIAISFPELADGFVDHGVFLSSPSCNIAKVWHKLPVSVLRSYGAVDDFGNVNIDTGAVFFAPWVLSSLFSLVCDSSGICSFDSFHKYVNEVVAPSLYVDFFYPLAEDSTYEGYLAEIPEGRMSPELLAFRELVWGLLRPYRIKLLSMSPAKFIHFGTTSDVHSLMSSGIDSYAYLGWRRQVCSGVSNPNVACYSSSIDSSVVVGAGAYIENSIVAGSSAIGSDTIVSCCRIVDRTIPSGVVLHCLKLVSGGFVCRIYGVWDNPKWILNEGASLCGFDLCAFMTSLGLSSFDLWHEGEEQSIWNARLYPECSTVEAAQDAALNLYALLSGSGDLHSWRNSSRHSLCSSFNKADGKSLCNWEK